MRAALWYRCKLCKVKFMKTDSNTINCTSTVDDFVKAIEVGSFKEVKEVVHNCGNDNYGIAKLVGIQIKGI